MQKDIKKGKIIFDPKRKPWPHEMHTARILAQNGHTVTFLKEMEGISPDIILDGIIFEIKAPKTAKISTLEQAIRKALKQSPNIIIDSVRMKIQDNVALKFLVKKCCEQKQIKRMIFINKKEKIIDVFNLI